MSLLGLEDVLHHREALVGVEVARLRGDDLEPAVRALLLDLVGEALGAVLGDRDAGEALDLDHVALALQLLGDVVRREHADLVVVAEDRRGRGVGRREQAVDVDDGDACASRPSGRPGSAPRRPAAARRARPASRRSPARSAGPASRRPLPRAARSRRRRAASAAACAFFEIAPSQPWSVGGTLAMILTSCPIRRSSTSCRRTPSVRGRRRVVVVVVAHAGGRADASSRAAATEMKSRLRDMSYLLVG